MADDAMDLNDEGVEAAARVLYDRVKSVPTLTYDIAYPSEQDDFRRVASAMLTAYLRAVPESDERQAWRVLRCPKCGSRNTECQARPHVHRCLDCGYDGTATALSPDEAAGGE